MVNGKWSNSKCPHIFRLRRDLFARSGDAGRSGDVVTEMRGKFFFPHTLLSDLQRVTFLSRGKIQIFL